MRQRPPVCRIALTLVGRVYRRLPLARLRRAPVDSVILTGEVLMVAGVSAAPGWALSRAKMPFLYALFAALIILTLLPALSTTLPALLP